MVDNSEGWGNTPWQIHNYIVWPVHFVLLTCCLMDYLAIFVGTSIKVFAVSVVFCVVIENVVLKSLREIWNKPTYYLLSSIVLLALLDFAFLNPKF